MDFISVRELRSRSAAVWEALAAQRRMVVTSNGKPIAFLVATSPEIFDSTLEALRQVEALQALESIRQSARESGAAELSLDEIDAEIAASRAARRP